MKKAILLFLAVVLPDIVHSPVQATIISGSFHTEFYSYRARFPEDEHQLRSLQGLKLNLKDVATPGLSVFVRGRIASDIVEKLPEDPDFRVYGAYMQYEEPNDILSMRLGRQFVYEGLSGFTMDGGWLKFNYKKLFSVAGLAGSTPGPSFYNYDEINDWDKSNALGGRFLFLGIPHFKLGASYLEREMEGILDSRLMGIDSNFKKGPFANQIRLDYDESFERIKLISVRNRCQLQGGHTVGLEYTYRRPSFGRNDIFSVFKAEPHNQIRLNTIYKFNSDLHGTGSVAYTKLSDDSDVSVRIGGSVREQSAGIVFADGYGGAKLGVYGFLNRRMNDNLAVYLRADMYNYKLDSDQDDSNSSLSTALGGRYRLMDGLYTMAELQILSNIRYDYDTRFYVRAEYAFTSVISSRETNRSW